MFAGMHFGRAWSGHEIEDECPCPQAPCGLVDGGAAADGCPHHDPAAMRTMRQGHTAENCPGTDRVAPVRAALAAKRTDTEEAT